MRISKILAGMSAMALAASMAAITTSADESAEISFFCNPYIQNRGDSWQWYDTNNGSGENTGGSTLGTYEIKWTVDHSGMSLYTPQQDGEQTPTFGIQLGCSNITEVDDAGAISGNITNFHIEASTNVDLDDTTISGDLLGKQESWGLSGNSQQVDFSDQIKDKLGADDAAYMEWLESVSEVSYTLELTQCEAKGVVMKAADAGESSVAESSAAESSAAESSAASSTATSSTATSSKSSTTSSKSSTTSSKSSTTTSSKAASSTAASDNTANTATGATAGIALAGLALAGAVAVVSKKK